MKKLLDEGLVEECDAPKDVDSEDGRRRYYRVTKLGKATVKRERERLSMLVELGEVFG
jgi:DNA-binding PadR family transcriptional regulator